jgi:8-oxo-dGTP diphosphatase
MTARRFTSEHPIFSVTADLVVLTLRDGVFSVLLVRRGGAPYAGRLALPGGFVQEREDIETAAYRELEEEAGVGPEDVVLEQLRTYGRPNRDPRGRVVTVAWLAMGANLPDPKAGSDAADAMWVPVEEALAEREALAFDHDEILRDGVERARAKLEYSGLGAAFCGPVFTVAELRTVYEAVWGRRLDKANFHRKVTGAEGFLRPTGEHTREGRGRPARLFRASADTILHPPLLRDR